MSIEIPDRKTAGYPIGYRKQVVDYALSHPNVPLSTVADNFNVNTKTVKQWKALAGPQGYCWQDIEPTDINGVPLPTSEEHKRMTKDEYYEHYHNQLQLDEEAKQHEIDQAAIHQQLIDNQSKLDREAAARSEPARRVGKWIKQYEEDI